MTHTIPIGWELLLYTVMVGCLIPLTPFLIRRMAKREICFFTPNTNYIYYVERGGSRNSEGHWEGGVLDHYITEVPGWHLEGPNLREMQFVPGDAPETFFHTWLGVRFFGISPFKHIRHFKIKKVYENLEGKGPKDWVRRGTEGGDWVNGLRFNFPRPFVYTDIELKDKLTADAKTVLELRVVRPYIPVYVFHGDFFTQTGSLLQGELLDILKKFSISKFLQAKKSENDGILKKLKEPKEDPEGKFNRLLVNAVGLEVVNIAINDVVPSNQEALKAKALAEEQGQALVLTAEKGRDVAIIEADGKAKALLRLNEAQVIAQNKLTDVRANRIRQTMASLAGSLADPNVVAKGTADIIEMEAATSETSKLTTLVKDRSVVTVPVGGK